MSRDDLDATMELLDPSLVAHGTGYPGGVTNLDGYLKVQAEGIAELPGIKFSVDEVIAEGDSVAVRYSYGLPDHRQVVVLVTARLVNGRVVEFWQVGNAFPA